VAAFLLVGLPSGVFLMQNVRVRGTMIETITETERKVINILVAYGDAPNAYTDPLHAVDRAMGWATAQTMAFVEQLVRRKLVRVATSGRDGASYNPRRHWEEITT
jgi:hypothetical protein